jgi:hypothetical protein
MIPPNRSGYGELMRASLLTARECYERLVHWDAVARTCGETLPYRLLPLSTQAPDTNIVCFLVMEQRPSSLAHQRPQPANLRELHTRRARLQLFAAVLFVAQDF